MSPPTTLEPITLPGVEPSADIRERYRGKDMILTFSRGKDSLAAWVLMRRAGINVYPYFMYHIPGLKFVDESVRYYERVFDCKILQLPHPATWTQLRELVYQSPDRWRVLQACNIAPIHYIDMDNAAREYFGLGPDVPVADGVRACDNINRRSAIAKYGPHDRKRNKYHILWDWRRRPTFDVIRDAGIDLPPDYAWFGRSFDGIDYRFTEPLSRHAPEDYATLLTWFPLAGADLMRRKLKKRYGS